MHSDAMVCGASTQKCTVSRTVPGGWIQILDACSYRGFIRNMNPYYFTDSDSAKADANFTKCWVLQLATLFLPWSLSADLRP